MTSKSLIFNTLPRTGMNYISFICSFSLDRTKYPLKSFEQIHSPAFASVTPDDAIQFFIKRDPIDSIQSNIYAMYADKTENEIIDILDKREGQNITDWILHLSNAAKNKNLEIICFDDFKKDTVSLLQKISERTGLPFIIDEKIVKEAVAHLDSLYKMNKIGYNYMPINKSNINSMIKDYLVSNDLYGQKDIVYNLYNALQPTVVL